MNNLNKLIFVRRALGIYFLLILLFLFSIRGMVYLTPGDSVLPSMFFLRFFERATEIQLDIAFLLGCFFSVLFTFGILQQVAALVMFLSLNFLIHANTLLMEIHYTYLGWLLLVFVLSPTFTKKYENPEHEQMLLWWSDKLTIAALYALGISFTYLGIVKMLYPYYYKSDLADFLLSIPDAHPHNAGIFDFINVFLKKYLSANFKMALGLCGAVGELVILPLIVFRKTRMLAHILVFLVLLYIGALVNYWHISLLMMIFQLTALDMRDIKTKSQVAFS